MKIGIVGAGNVGTVFGWYLKEKGLNLLGYYSKKEQSAIKSADFTSSNSLSLEILTKRSDIIFITTPDGEIEKVCNLIATKIGFSHRQTVVHMSGALKSDILVKANEQGASVFSLHPMQSFANIKDSTVAIKNTFFTMEGVGNKSSIVKLLKMLGNPYKEIEPEHKPLYHAAACIASNYLVTLTGISAQILTKIGFNENEGVEVLLPLMEGTLRNIKNLGVKDALTGPIVRGDSVTIKNHLDHLEESTKKMYSQLGLKTLDIAKKRGLDIGKSKDIENLFEGSD